VDMVRQGDVLLVRIADERVAGRANLQPIKRDEGRVVLAYGEETGHAHAIGDPGALLLESEDDGTCFLQITSTTALLQHEEHGPIPLAAGWYEVVQQQQWGPNGSRPIAD